MGPAGLADKPIYVFETGGTTGVPKSRVVIDDFRIDYELFSETLPDEYFPRGSNWLMLGPSGPRRLRLAVEHLAQFRGGICFCIDLDPRWVIKLIKKGWMEHLEAYKQHCIEQAITVLTAGHEIKCMFATPKLLESLALGLEDRGTSIPEIGITGIFSGGTEFTPQWTRYAVEELFGGPPEESGVYMTPTYGNTLMGLACSRTHHGGRRLHDLLLRSSASSRHGGRCVSTITLARWTTAKRDASSSRRSRRNSLFPGSWNGMRASVSRPATAFPWDGVSGVRPFHELAQQTTVGVY